MLLNIQQPSAVGWDGESEPWLRPGPFKLAPCSGGFRHCCCSTHPSVQCLERAAAISGTCMCAAALRCAAGRCRLPPPQRRRRPADTFPFELHEERATLRSRNQTRAADRAPVLGRTKTGIRFPEKGGTEEGRGLRAGAALGAAPAKGAGRAGTGHERGMERVSVLATAASSQGSPGGRPSKGRSPGRRGGRGRMGEGIWKRWGENIVVCMGTGQAQGRAGSL